MQRKVKIGLVLCTIVITCLVMARPNIGWFGLSFLIGESNSNIHFTVSSTADDRPILTFDRMTNYRKPALIGIVFYELVSANPETHRAVWMLVQDKPGGGYFASLTYGCLPPGYKETLAAKPLLAGHFYKMDGSDDIFEKIGPCQYEMISIDRYRNEMQNRLMRMPKYN